MNNKKHTLKLGIVGCGCVTETRHLPALRKLAEVEVVAVADTDAARLNDVADYFGISRRYSAFETLLRDTDIEAIAICVPTQFHAQLSLAALDAGKHLFIEKPLALTLDESERLMERANRSSQIVMVGFNLRWHRLVRQARRIIEEGKLGELKMVNTIFTSGSRNRGNLSEWKKSRRLGGGVVIEQAIHHFDLWRALLQSEVQEVFVKAQNEDETAIVSAHMENGVLLTAAFSEGTTDNNEFHFYGQSASLHLNCYRFDGLRLLPNTGREGDILVRLKSAATVIKHFPQMFAQLYQGGDYVASYRNEWRHFIHCVQNRLPAEQTVEDAHRAQQILMAALESATLNQPLKVSRAPRMIAAHI